MAKIATFLLWLLLTVFSVIDFAPTVVKPKPKSIEDNLTPEQKFQMDEVTKCFVSPHYFITNYVKILDPQEGKWIPFDLWDAQEETLNTIALNKLVVILKARQIGLSWLVLGYALWLMLFRPIASILLFSKRDTEAVALLDERLKGMFKELPDFLRYGIYAIESNDHNWRLSNGSVARAFPATSGGDSYTATLVVIDEADLVPNLGTMIAGAKPTIDAGGQMVMLSRSNKDEPQSDFKKTYKAAKLPGSAWVAVFLPWHVRPARTIEWYATIKAEVKQRTGSLDELWEQYPATDTEALAARTLSKRIPPEWLEQVYKARDPLHPTKDFPPIEGLKVYVTPQPRRRYVVGLDSAEGNVHSDDSAFVVLDVDSGEEVCSYLGKVEPDTLMDYGTQVARWYNRAYLMPEINNSGYAMITWFKDNAPFVMRKRLLYVEGNNKGGWRTNKTNKAAMYSDVAADCRDEGTIIHSFELWEQLASIEASTLSAPAGQHDDYAMAYAVANVARPLVPVPTRVSNVGGLAAKRKDAK